MYMYIQFSWWLSGKESACLCRRCWFIPKSGRFPGEGNGNPLQYSCLRSPMDSGACQTTIHGVARVGHDLVTRPTYVYNLKCSSEFMWGK